MDKKRNLELITFLNQFPFGILLLDNEKIRIIEIKYKDPYSKNYETKNNHYSINEFINIVYREDRKSVKKFFKEITSCNSNNQKNCAFRFLHNNTLRWIELCYGDQNPQQNNFAISVFDVTKRKELEKNYQNILELINDIYIEIRLDGKINFFNKTFEEFMECSRDDILGRNFIDFIEEKNQEVFLEFFEKFDQKKGNYFTFECKFTRNNGKKKNTKVTIFPKVSKNNKIESYSILAQKIIENRQGKRLEKNFDMKLKNAVKEKTKELNDLLKQQKLYQKELLKASRFKTEFLATMSHELRTPLNAIIGFTDLLIEESFGDLNNEQLEYLNDIKESAEHQYDMVNKILNLTKIEAGQLKLDLKEFSLNSVLDQIKSTFKPQIRKKNLEFKIVGLEDDMKIYADPIRFKEILLNLVSNAIKFTIQGYVTVSIKETHNEWVFKVRDSGIGIARDDYDLVFEEFKRIDSTYVRSTSGTGLGLSLTKRLINLHGGNISFISMLGVGTTFTFTIPKNLPEYDVKLI